MKSVATVATFAGAVLAALVVMIPTTAMARPVTTWDRIIRDPARFRVPQVFRGEAVFDRETGLLWEQQPHELAFTFAQAHQRCALAPLGGRFGWRLPTVSELGSLLEPAETEPALPPGHPFALHANLLAPHGEGTIWTSTPVEVGTQGTVWGVSLMDADFGHMRTDSNVGRVWCVRGGVGVNQ